MSRKGDCWDNAVVESFNATIKTELIHRTKWKTREEVRAAVYKYIESASGKANENYSVKVRFDSAVAGRSIPSLAGDTVTYRLKRRQGNIWGTLLSHVIIKIASAELVFVNEGSTNVIDMRDDADSPGSENVSRMHSSHWNLRGPIESGRVVPAGGMRQGKTRVALRDTIGSRTDSYYL